jgi:ATP-dependent exoDNAse (exonuclease V) alpha subunit
MMLSPDQQLAFEAAYAGANIFITGPGGTGKSFLVHEIVDALRAKDRNVQVTASTGIAAVQVNGCTIHKYLGTGIARNLANAKKWYDGMQSNMHRGLSKRISGTDVLVVDEVSMLSGDFINMASGWLRKFGDEHRPFGGKQVIFVGDFMQLPPVDPKNRDRDKYAFQAAAWTKAGVNTYELTTPHRQADPEFVAALNRLRFGELSDADAQMFAVCVGRRLEDPTELLSTNNEVDRVNARQLAALPGETFIVRGDVQTRHGLSEVKAVNAHTNLLKSCITPEVLELKVGAPVLMTVNDPSGRFVNGTRATVVSLHPSTPGELAAAGTMVKVEINGEEHEVLPHRWKYLDGSNRVDASLLQLPVRLAWALTIHKSQGLTLDRYKVNLIRCFAAGQAYVALSRASRIEGLELADVLKPEQIFANPTLVEFYTEKQHD